MLIRVFSCAVISSWHDNGTLVLCNDDRRPGCWLIESHRSASCYLLPDGVDDWAVGCRVARFGRLCGERWRCWRADGFLLPLRADSDAFGGERSSQIDCRWWGCLRWRARARKGHSHQCGAAQGLELAKTFSWRVADSNMRRLKIRWYASWSLALGSHSCAVRKAELISMSCRIWLVSSTVEDRRIDRYHHCRLGDDFCSIWVKYCLADSNDEWRWRFHTVLWVDTQILPRWLAGLIKCSVVSFFARREAR